MKHNELQLDTIKIIVQSCYKDGDKYKSNIGFFNESRCIGYAVVSFNENAHRIVSGSSPINKADFSEIEKVVSENKSNIMAHVITLCAYRALIKAAR